jgi:CBS domain-containing protein
MTVAAILDTKGTNVVLASPATTMAEAVALLAGKRIGALVVCDAAGTLCGILSERDVVRALARDGGAALERPLADYMTAEVETTERAEIMPSLMERMTDGRFRHMPVVEDGRLLGIVSIGDVVKFRVAEIEAEAHAMREYIRAG